MVINTVDPDSLLENEDAEEGDEESSDPMDLLLSALEEMFENGLPVKFKLDPQDPFVLPMVRRIHRQNEILADISASLRSIAKSLGSQLPATIKDADLKK